MLHARTAGFALGALLALSACQPGLNWREVRPPDSGLQALFPCKPDVEQRGAAGQRMGLAQCETGGARYAVSWAELPVPSAAGAALAEMPRALALKLRSPLPAPSALVVPGATPQAQAAQYLLKGGGSTARLAVFSRGPRVYQALRLGPADDASAWETFLGSLRLGEAPRPGG